ncbi:MAG: hypothetical protein OSB41_03895 [Kiritimatiellae bacterium]|nr:hypothetical protein [Kiritimatiellia bacterium]
MSLIQEALRRQQEEQSGDGSAPAAATPSAGETATLAAAAPTAASSTPSFVPASAPPLPPPPQPPTMTPPPSPADAAASVTPEKETASKGRPWGSHVGLIAIVAVVLAGLVGLMVFAFGKVKESKDSRSLAINAPAQPAGANPASATAPPDGKPAMPGIAADAKPTTAAPKPGAPAVASGETGAVQPAAAAAWPKVTLTGVVGKGIRGAATLNGQIVAVGESIQGAEVVYIGDEGVKLEFASEERHVKIGQTIN